MQPKVHNKEIKVQQVLYIKNENEHKNRNLKQISHVKIKRS